MAALQRPPIPQSPLVDEKGFVTREWWRWFASIGVVVAEQGSQIGETKTTIENVVVFDAPLAPLDEPVDTTDVVRQSLALRVLQDALSTTTIDPDQAALRALELTLQQDPLPIDQLALAPQLLRLPADPLPIDQLALLAQLLQLPADPIRGGAFVSSESSATTTSLTTNTNTDLATISLAPGDWDVWGVAGFVPAGTPSQFKSWISTVSATGPTFPNGGTQQNIFAGFTAASNFVTPVGMCRLNLSVQTTVYLSCLAQFTLTCTAGAGLYARRLGDRT